MEYKLGEIAYIQPLLMLACIVLMVTFLLLVFVSFFNVSLEVSMMLIILKTKLSIKRSSNIKWVDNWVHQHFDDWHKHVNMNCKDTIINSYHKGVCAIVELLNCFFIWSRNWMQLCIFWQYRSTFCFIFVLDFILLWFGFYQLWTLIFLFYSTLPECTKVLVA